MRPILNLPAGWGAKVVASSVRFLRVGVRLWVFLTGAIGFDFETFTGPFASLLFALTILTGIGTFLAEAGGYFTELQQKMRSLLILRQAAARR
jgi:hypothetical protein